MDANGESLPFNRSLMLNIDEPGFSSPEHCPRLLEIAEQPVSTPDDLELLNGSGLLYRTSYISKNRAEIFLTKT